MTIMVDTVPKRKAQFSVTRAKLYSISVISPPNLFKILQPLAQLRQTHTAGRHAFPLVLCHTNASAAEEQNGLSLETEFPMHYKESGEDISCTVVTVVTVVTHFM